MDFKHEQNAVILRDETGALIAEVTFPAVGENTVNLNHTFVDDSLRGQGVAGKLMQEAAADLRKTGRKAVLTCSYAVAWFPKHPEYDDILAKPDANAPQK